MPVLNARDGTPRIWFETNGDASNAPVVLLHGFTGTHRTWDLLAQRLARRHLLVLPDLPGHGRSGVSLSTAAMGLGPTSDAIAEVIRRTAGAAGTRKAALLGYSLGGRVALDLACRHQELLSCLVLEGASPGIEVDEEREERRATDDALADEIERNGIERFVDHWQETPLFATQKDLPPQVFHRIRRERLSNSAHGLAMSLRAAGTGAMVPLWKRMEDLRMPVLLVVGERDRRYAEMGEAMRRRIPGSIMAEVEGAGHCVHLEKPEAFADLVERFLAHRLTMMPAAPEEEKEVHARVHRMTSTALDKIAAASSSSSSIAMKNTRMKEKRRQEKKKKTTTSSSWETVKEYEDILFQRRGGIAKLTINRPQVRNAFRPETLFELSEAFTTVRNDPTIGVAILTGAGEKAFCSGGDQKVRGHAGYMDKQGVPRLNVLDLQKQIRSLPKPVIAMVAGYAIGGGHVLHLVCDLTIAAENAVFGQTGPRVGSFDAGFEAGLLARTVGPKKAKEIWYLCRRYDAQEALRMGLVNTVVPLPSLEEETLKWGEEILQMSPTAIRFMKAAFNADTDGLAGLQELAGDATMLYYMTDEAKEGRDAFLQKRRPDFRKYPWLP